MTLIPNLTYQNTPYWFNQTRRDWQLDLLLPFDYAQEATHPVVLWLSGGSWQMMDRASYLPELVFLARAGFVVASIDYHMGSEAAFPAQVQDVRQALAYLATQQATYHLDMQQVTLMGDSAGGQVALVSAYTMGQNQLNQQPLGSSTPIKNVVAYYAPTDLAALAAQQLQYLTPAQQFDYLAPMNFLVGQMQFDATALQQASPVNYVKAGVPSTLLLQGDADDWVPFEQAQLLATKLQAVGITHDILKLRGGQHIDARFFANVINQAVLDFIK
ncbi:esterase lipase [Agrilactobacillus composti DSM 18527 = JCM 14202]|uniref:Esterase lipase n=1 Tax=Agrilactobacillus composti DSM 18527 = JCM 14202 TaxID=1423734 RepID=A0A0R1Y0Z8_9LACO|nr:esterase lipase [Agrilactobacillus composti DSM 18527 = JCM 14202]